MTSPYHLGRNAAGEHNSAGEYVTKRPQLLLENAMQEAFMRAAGQSPPDVEMLLRTGYELVNEVTRLTELYDGLMHMAATDPMAAYWKAKELLSVQKAARAESGSGTQR